MRCFDPDAMQIVGAAQTHWIRPTSTILVFCTVGAARRGFLEQRERGFIDGI